MQTASAPLAAALTSKERTLVLRVKADWGRDGTYTYDPGVFRDVFSDTFEGAGEMGDLSGWVESATWERSLSTDLPDGAKLTTGFGAADATITLNGALSGDTPLVRALSAHPDAAATMRRVNTPVYIEMGAVGTAGAEYLRQFTGKIRTIGLNPLDGTVSISALDLREQVRTPVALPMSVGVSAGTFLTAIAAANGATTAFDTSLNTAVSTPVQDTSDPWDTLQQIVAAEQGVIFFDEAGTLTFYNRNHMSGGASVATVTTDPATFANLKTVLSEESIDSVRNYVTVQAVPLALDPPATELWRLAEASGVPANSSIAFPMDFGAPIYAVLSLNYLASITADGTGGDVTNLTLSFTVTGTTSGVVTVNNPNGYDVFLVYNIGYPANIGEPMLTVGGQCLRPATDGGYTSVAQDTGSASLYGTQPLDVAANVWRQSMAAADGLAASLILALREPHPTLSGVEVVPDPRRQLTDRVRVAETDGLELNDDFWTVGINTRFSASDVGQSLTLRAV